MSTMDLLQLAKVCRSEEEAFQFLFQKRRDLYGISCPGCNNGFPAAGCFYPAVPVIPTGSWSRPGDHPALPVHAAAVPGTTIDRATAFHGADPGAGLLVDNIDAARRMAALGRHTLQIIRA